MNDMPYEPQPQQPNGIATVGLVLGVLALCGGILSIPGIVCSGIGLAKAGQRGGSGRGKAIIGLVLSIVGLVLIGPLALILGLAIPAYQKVREAKQRQLDSTNYKQVALTLSNYNMAYGEYPLSADRNSRVPIENRLSWRVAVLPYLEQGYLFDQFNMYQPWDSPTNRRLSTTVVPAFADRETPDDPDTRIRIFYNNGALFDTTRPARITNIPDGSSATVMAVEGGEKVTWSRFQEYKFDPNADLPSLGKPKNSYFFAIMADGSVRSVKKSISPQVIKSAIHASDGVGGFND